MNHFGLNIAPLFSRNLRSIQLNISSIGHPVTGQLTVTSTHGLVSLRTGQVADQSNRRLLYKETGQLVDVTANGTCIKIL